MPATAVEREFYLGVEAAAEEVLHPELEMTRTEHWVRVMPPEYREGYTRTSTMLARARTAEEVPLQLRLPNPPGLTPGAGRQAPASRRRGLSTKIRSTSASSTPNSRRRGTKSVRT